MKNTTETPSTPAAVSFAPEVIADSSGQFIRNGLRFATEAEAKDYASDLSARWTSVRETRVVPTPDPANYCLKNGNLSELN